MSTEDQIQESQSVDNITEFYEKNKNNILIAGIALIALAAGIYYYGNVYKPQIEEEAAENLFMAERYFTEDSFDLALNGDGTHLGLRDVADEFTGTMAGNQAAYYAGRILLEKGQYEEALDYFFDVSMDDEFMASQVIVLQGDCYSELGQYEEAGDKYLNAANKRTNILTTPYALNKAGLAYEKAEDYSEALDVLTELKENYGDSEYASSVDARIGRVKAKLSAQ